MMNLSRKCVCHALAWCFFLAAPVWAQQPAAPAVSPEIEEELKPRPELGHRTIDSLSPEAQNVLRERLMRQSNRILPPVPPEVKQSMFMSMMASSPMSMRDYFNFMTSKMKAKEGLSFDEIVEAMDLKANDVNFKKTVHSKIWQDIAAITGVPTTRIEVLQYCDAVVARRILDVSPEFSVFIPCRISVYEDANGDIWLMTMDWDISWLAFAWQPGSQISQQLKEDAVRLRSAMDKIMKAGATGEW